MRQGPRHISCASLQNPLGLTWMPPILWYSVSGRLCLLQVGAIEKYAFLIFYPRASPWLSHGSPTKMCGVFTNGHLEGWSGNASRLPLSNRKWRPMDKYFSFLPLHAYFWKDSQSVSLEILVDGAYDTHRDGYLDKASLPWLLLLSCFMLQSCSFDPWEHIPKYIAFIQALVLGSSFGEKQVRHS